MSIKTIALAAISMAVGSVLGYLVCAATNRYLRRRVKMLRQAVVDKPPEKMGVMDKVLIFEAAVLIAYTAADLVVFWHTGAEPYTLTACVFGLCGIENGVMGWIKTNKDKAAEAERREKNTAPEGPEPEREEPPDVGL